MKIRLEFMFLVWATPNGIVLLNILNIYASFTHA